MWAAVNSTSLNIFVAEVLKIAASCLLFENDIPSLSIFDLPLKHWHEIMYIYFHILPFQINRSSWNVAHWRSSDTGAAEASPPRCADPLKCVSQHWSRVVTTGCDCVSLTSPFESKIWDNAASKLTKRYLDFVLLPADWTPQLEPVCPVGRTKHFTCWILRLRSHPVWTCNQTKRGFSFSTRGWERLKVATSDRSCSSRLNDINT